MLSETLNATVKNLNSLNNAEKTRNLYIRKKDYEERLLKLANDYKERIDWIKRAESVGFTKSSSLLKSCQAGHNELIALVRELNGENNTYESSKLDPFRTDIRNLSGNIESDWAEYYKETISPTIKLLNVIEQLEPGKTQRYKRILEDSKKWTVELDSNRVVETKITADALVRDLNLNDAVRTFLLKVNKRIAHLDDIDEEVSEWIRENGFERKFRISF